MNSKVLVGGILGGIGFFLLGYLLYGLLMKDAMAGCTSCQRPMEELNFPLLFVGNLFVAFAIAYAFSKMTGVSSFTSGAMTGGTLGLLMAIGYGSIGYATSTTFTSMTCVIYQVVIELIMWSVVGGIIGWWMGRKK